MLARQSKEEGRGKMIDSGSDKTMPFHITPSSMGRKKSSVPLKEERKKEKSSNGKVLYLLG